MNFKKMQQGFTLIELMIVVAIIGILAAIAIPAYQDYMIRSKVTEAMAAAAACKTSVTEYYQSNASLPSDITAAGCSSTATTYVASLDVTSAGIIDVTLGTVGGTASGTHLGLLASIASSNITGWDCKSTNGVTTVPAKYLPAICR
jgi:type IV pilus assembly protein PilA